MITIATWIANMLILAIAVILWIMAIWCGVLLLFTFIDKVKKHWN